jgi:hypothetical protein
METLAEGPETRERAVRIGSSYVSEVLSTICPHCSAVLFVRNGKCEDCGKRVTPPEKQRVVFDAWPLKRLHARYIITDIQYSAGDRYYKHWYLSGLSSFGGGDFGRVGKSSSGPTYGMAATEKQAYHRELYRLGEEKLGIGISSYVNSVVLQEQEPEAVGLRISGRTAVNQARAAAIEIVKIGLDRLADAYGLQAKRY